MNQKGLPSALIAQVPHGWRARLATSEVRSIRGWVSNPLDQPQTAQTATIAAGTRTKEEESSMFPRPLKNGWPILFGS